jgi:hypothetical protein
MSDIKLCDITNGTIELQGNSIKASITLPKNPVPYYKPKLFSEKWALEVYKELFKEGIANFATEENPTRPVSGGTIDLIGDLDKNFYVYLTRKDLDSPRHPGHLAPNNGYPSQEEEWSNPSLIISREGAEERFYLTEEGKLLTPSDEEGKEATLDSAKRLGISTKKIDDSKISYLSGPDTLEIFNHKGKLLYKETGYFMWSAEVGPSLIKLRQINADHNNIIPYDGEGLHGKDGSLCSPLNRETFVFSKQDLVGLTFGDPLNINRNRTKDPIYIWETKEGKRRIQTQKPIMNDDYLPGPEVEYPLNCMGIKGNFNMKELKLLKDSGFPTEFTPLTNIVSRVIKRTKNLV